VSTEPATVPVEIHAPEDLAGDQLSAVRDRVAKLGRYTDEPIANARLTLRHPQTHASRLQWVADATLLLNGRPLAAHATGKDPVQATDEVVDRLRRQILRVTGSEVARRNDPRELQRGLAEPGFDRRHRPAADLKPPELRDVIPTRTPYPLPETTLDAVADLLDLDLEFLLFRHARTGEDVVVYRRDDGRIGLLHPPGSPLADENDIAVPEPSRYPEPIPYAKARDEMDALNHRFLYFIDAADGRGKVLYLRHDGDYGLVELPPIVDPPPG
jgi:ribosome-associated translation inhibitor RaiA